MIDDMRDQSLQLPEGRTMAWTEYGAGTPLLRIPGTPGSRWAIRADRTPWRDRRLHVITTERPGYGASTPLPGRGFAEHAHDLAALLDHLGLDTVYVMASSGGAPHLLAFAALHPDRVRAATVVVGATPVEESEIAQMIELNAHAQRLVRAGDDAGLRALLAPVRDALLADPLAGIRGVMAEAPEEDQQIMADPLWQEAFVRGVREALEQGLDGWAAESTAIIRPWRDFDVADVRASLTWWHGDEDRNAPLTAARRLIEKLPNATLNIWTQAGHLTPYRLEGQILDELLARG
ncbi:MAG TPA: alpha/beta hydrolase [Jatrophihabitans sp.]|nr:alpha/beta hydrolase [Jatrophihabitans sp.]